MSKYKICVYAIAKNEEKFVDRWMDAVGEADLIVVLDTGSTDHTVQKLRARGANVYVEKINPWRFVTARNLAMDHIPEDVDICVSNDLDEVFEKGWREKLEYAWKPNYTRARYLFTYTFHEDGTPEKQYAMEKIHRRNDFRWVHPVHEILEYSGKDADRTVFVPGLVLNHYPDPSKSRGQYLPLLELSVQENPNDDRAVFWLGREYMYNDRLDECISTLNRHLKMPTATWDEERSASMRFIAECYRRKNDFGQAKAWLFRSIGECPHVREPYLQIARLGYSRNDWPLVYFATEQALKITQKTGSYLLEPQSWGFLLDDYAAIACFWLGLPQKALEHAQKALDFQPDDERLKNNLQIIRQKAE